MADTRKKNRTWNCGADNNTTFDQAKLAVLMDIRDELQALNRLLNCRNFIGMPRDLRQINKRLAKDIKISVRGTGGCRG